MVSTYSEKIEAHFEGTIIDLETIGYFDDRYDDSRRYRNIIPVIFGYVNRDGIRILCAEDRDSIATIGVEIIKVLDALKGPFYAFNSDKSVRHNNCLLTFRLSGCYSGIC